MTDIIAQLAELSAYLRQPNHDPFVALAIAEQLRDQLLAMAQADSD